MTAHELAKKLLEMPDVEAVLDLNHKFVPIIGVYEAEDEYGNPEIRIFSHE